MANQSVVDKSHGYASPTASFTAKKQTHTISTQSARTNPSSAQKTLPHAVPLVGQQLKEQGFSTTAARVIQSLWKSRTRKQYTCYVEKWISYCGKRNLNPIHSNVKEGINFLAELLDLGLGYSAINTARSALSSILSMSEKTTFGAHPLVCRFLRGMFAERPSLPRYKTIWDVNTVLKYLKGIQIDKDLTLRDLTLKLTMLLALLSGQRCHTLHLLSLEGMSLKAQQCTFKISEPIKTTKPGSKALEVQFKAYSTDLHLCVVHHLRLYLERTKPLRPQLHDTGLLLYRIASYIGYAFWLHNTVTIRYALRNKNYSTLEVI